MIYDEDFNYTFTVDNGLYGPAIAAIIGLEVITGISANALVLILTLCNLRVLKQPSIIFLTNLAIGNLVTSIFSVSTYAVTMGFEEWVFGETVQQKIATCQFAGFIKTNTIISTSFAFALISFDRFLFIVKPMVYKNRMKPWIAIAACFGSCMISVMMGVIPLLGLGVYEFEPNTGSCLIKGDSRIFLIIAFILVSVCVTIVSVTTLWTFCFTYKFVKRFVNQATEGSKNVYNRRVKKLFGIFGALLTVTAASYVLPSVIFVLRIVVGSERIPAFLPTLANVLYFLNTVFNPIIQLYFRNDLKERIQVLCKRYH